MSAAWFSVIAFFTAGVWITLLKMSLMRWMYDAHGQLLTGSLMDYLLPTARDVPHITLIHQETRSPLNPLGVKGLGEGGAIAPPVAIANAVCDALAPFGIEFNSTPIGPEQIVRAVREARSRQGATA